MMAIPYIIHGPISKPNSFNFSLKGVTLQSKSLMPLILKVTALFCLCLLSLPIAVGLYETLRQKKFTNVHFTDSYGIHKLFILGFCEIFATYSSKKIERMSPKELMRVPLEKLTFYQLTLFASRTDVLTKLSNEALLKLYRNPSLNKYGLLDLLPQEKQAVLSPCSKIVAESKLTKEEFRAIEKYMDTKCRVSRTPQVIRRDESKLARSLLVFPEGKVFALLKQKGGMKSLGEGQFKKATWAVDIHTGAKKVFVSERRESLNKGERPIPDNEVEALGKYANNPLFVAGDVVRYKFKYTHYEKRGYLSDPCLGGDLKEKLKGQPLTEPQVIKIANGLAESLAFMHKQADMHLDVKPANVMLENGVPRLGDFTLVRKIGLSRVTCGTEAYMAPEIFHSYKADEKADVFSYGLLLYDLKMHAQAKACLEFGGNPPGRASESQLEQWKSQKLLNRHEANSLDYIIDRCLKYNPEHRMSMKDVCVKIATLNPKVSQEVREEPRLESPFDYLARIPKRNGPKLFWG